MQEKKILVYKLRKLLYGLKQSPGNSTSDLAALCVAKSIQEVNMTHVFSTTSYQVESVFICCYMLIICSLPE